MRSWHVMTSTQSLGSSRTHEGQDLVRREVEGVEHESEVRVLDQREEPVGAVRRPLQDEAFGIPCDDGFDEGMPLPDRPDVVPSPWSSARSASQLARTAAAVSGKRSRSRETRGARVNSLSAAPPAT